MASPADDRLCDLVKTIDRHTSERHDDDVGRQFEKALNDYTAIMRGAVMDDPGARKALEFLERKARGKAAKDGKLPPRDLLRDILGILPLRYRTPPARGARAEIRRQEAFAARLRDDAKTVREDIDRSWRVFPPDYYAPRKSKGAQIQVPDCPILVSHPELESLPEMLDLYASLLEKKAGLWRTCAKEEPTEKQWWVDAEARVLTWAKHCTGSCYREHVAAVLEALRPPRKGEQAIGRKAEALRKRAYRQRKSRPA